jgi:hypothetical protein
MEHEAGAHVTAQKSVHLSLLPITFPVYITTVFNREVKEGLLRTLFRTIATSVQIISNSGFETVTIQPPLPMWNQPAAGI